MALLECHGGELWPVADADDMSEDDGLAGDSGSDSDALS
jgi:hypothetical protein